jgi:small subunit ribosomal protein S3Ae
MAGKRTKVVDKWKSKKWYNVVAPEMFDKKQIAEVVASDEKQLQNRIIKKGLMELGTSGPSQIGMFTNLRFRITDVNGDTANTRFIGHEIASSFIKTFARRGKSLIHQIVDEKTKDGEDLRLKVIAVTGARVSQNTKKNIRAALQEVSHANIAENDFNSVMDMVITGKFSSSIFNRLKQITKMKRVEVWKSERGENFK